MAGFPADDGADELRRFLFEAQPQRGHWVRLVDSWQAAHAHQGLPANVRALLGEALAAVALLSAALKFQGTLTLQIQGGGVLPLLVAQATHDRSLRGMARLRDGVAVDPEAGLPGLAGEGQLVVSLETGGATPAWQGIVALDQPTLAACLQRYFENSEQLPTRLELAADGHQACGLLLQKLPLPASAGEVAAGQAQDLWDESCLLLGTLRREELLADGPRRLLGKLFAEHDVRLFDAEPVRFRCRCDRPRVAGLLRALGEAEVRDVLAEQGAVSVTCEFCQQPWRFDAIDVEQLFRPGVEPSAGGALN
ncbi:MAG: Hsp33 family molecular chaperone HslO [Pseudomonadota bacterium]